MDDVQAPVTAVLDQLARLVGDARSMPMSASCVVNRGEVLGLIDELRRALPEALRRATEVLDDRQEVVAEGRTEAERLLKQAKARQQEMVRGTEVRRAAGEDARRVLVEAEAEAEALRVEVEEYVDAKLANFEVVLSKTLDAVQRGRARLHGESELDELSDEPPRARGVLGEGPPDPPVGRADRHSRS